MWICDLADALSLSAFRLRAGKEAAGQLAAVADWHYPLGSPETPRQRRSRLYLRSLCYARSTARWLGFLWSDPSRLAAARSNRDLVEKIHRPYLRKDLGSAERLALLESHYRFGASQPHGALLVSATLRDFPLAELDGKTGKTLRLVLGPAGSLQKEGELRLSLEYDGLALLSLAFTLGMVAGGPALFVGCLQGSPDEAVREAIRDATKEMFGLRPRQLLLVALQAIARAYGLSAIVGVSDSLHIYRHWRKRREIMQSYDAMWLDLGATRQAGGMFELPLLHQQRPLTDYPSNKRSAMAKRQALEQLVAERILQTIARQGPADT
ncbi:MAG: hypothetical protein RJA36_2193 [Pseudomonadota bacterium]|jgi:uncharacterized protein VirK/YbjX